MKIIDFKRKGNVVRFYLGNDDCEDYHGDDWDDSPYDCNAGTAYDEYVVDHYDLFVPFEYNVLEPKDDWGPDRHQWSKDDMKARKVPCIVIAKDPDDWRGDEFSYYIGADSNDVIKIYFGDLLKDIRAITF